MPKPDPNPLPQDDPLADILESCVSDIQGRRRPVEECLALFPAAQEELEPLLRLAVRLQEARGSALPSAEFRQHAAVRMQNLLAASLRAPEWPVRRQETPGWRWPALQPVGVALIMLVLVVLAGSARTMVVAASALPGDLLYPVKTAVEEIRLAATTDPRAEIALHLELARSRLEEAAALESDPQAAGVATALQSYRRQLERALAILQNQDGLGVEDQQQLAVELVEQMEEFQRRLGDLAGRTPEQNRAMVGEALRSSEAAREMMQHLVGGEPVDPNPSSSTKPEQPGPPLPSPLQTPTATPSPLATATASPTAIADTPLPQPTPARPRVTITGLPAGRPGERPPIQPPADRTRVPAPLPRPTEVRTLMPPRPVQTRSWPSPPAITPPPGPTVTVPTVVVPTVTVPTVMAPTVVVPTVMAPTVVVPTVIAPTVIAPTVVIPSVIVPTVTLPDPPPPSPIGPPRRP